MSTKPPTQIAGVQGIAPKPIELTPKRIDWAHLFGLPPFQMFAVEKAGKSAADVTAWLPEWVGTSEQQALYDDYCQWHAAKGYWPGETPLGEVKPCAN